MYKNTLRIPIIIIYFFNDNLATGGSLTGAKNGIGAAVCIL